MADFQMCQLVWNQQIGFLFLPTSVGQWYLWWMWRCCAFCPRMPSPAGPCAGESRLQQCTHRREIILAVHSRMPELYSYCRSAYNQPSILFFGPYTVQSQEGTQQGDPIGPLLFCNTVHTLLSSLQSKLDIVFSVQCHFGWSRWHGGFWCCRDHTAWCRNMVVTQHIQVRAHCTQWPVAQWRSATVI